MIKLSTETVSLLKNFAQINQNLLFKEGNRLETISPQKNILAFVGITETFPQEFGIYDLNKFLGALSLFNGPELEFGEKSLSMDGKLDYVFADTTMLITPPEKELVLPDTEVNFKLTETDFSQTTKAAAVLGLPHICVEGKDHVLSLVATDVNNSGSDVYRTKLDKVKHNFNLVFKIENFVKLFPGDYQVWITFKGVCKFAHLVQNGHI